MNPPQPPSGPLDRFTLFSRLPYELRLMVWNFHLGDEPEQLARVIDVQFIRVVSMGPPWPNIYAGGRMEPGEIAATRFMLMNPADFRTLYEIPPRPEPSSHFERSLSRSNHGIAVFSDSQIPCFFQLIQHDQDNSKGEVLESDLMPPETQFFMDLGSIYALYRFWERDPFQHDYHGDTYNGTRRNTSGFDLIQNLATPLDRPAEGIQSWIVGHIMNRFTRVTTNSTVQAPLNTIAAVITSNEQELLNLSGRGLGSWDQRLVRRLYNAVAWDVTHFFQPTRTRRSILERFPGLRRGNRRGPNRLRGG
ncbi:hypothetical protein VTL71DRAFT_5945 [Oculimacula yallundae]|uniref:2EXR domain-containing protein n=1 Tax=Oculimacula yallundae TaxID=86028 RepID=A0ABR4C1I7_9HELO